MKKVAVKTSSQRDTITDVAIRLFGEHGYTGTTMRDIAKAVGVLPGSLYAHIPSKETLLLDIVKQGIARFLTVEHVLEAFGDSPEVCLRKAIQGHIEAVAEDPQRALVVFHQWRFLGEPSRSTAIEMRRRYADTFVKIIDAGKASGAFSMKLDTRIAVFTVLGALNWAPEWYSPKGPVTATDIANSLADTLIYGLRDAPSRGKARGSVAISRRGKPKLA